ncbi:DUF167 domain-containing protein [archaeon]|jgi:uncharacterized protein (TIGR00251 family)|nr:DUF167 domain-containing protein [archaeon]MBT6734975.1 DUF167 domain-containing protein [Candidatus Woesearchaeota archaeon]
MKIKIHANSSQEKLKKIDENFYEIWLREKPLDGRANDSLLKLLKKEFGKSFKIKSGLTSRIKIVEELE